MGQIIEIPSPFVRCPNGHVWWDPAQEGPCLECAPADSTRVCTYFATRMTAPDVLSILRAHHSVQEVKQ